jgi:hypothetical protein
MNTTTESLQTLVDKGIIDICTKHGEEPIYFGALETCPVCNEGRKQKLTKRKLKVEPVKPEPEEEVPQDTTLIGRMQSFVQNPKNRGKVIAMVVAVILLCWLYLNYAAIMSYFAR